MAKATDPEIIEPTPEREFDNPDLTPKDFLLAVMRDRRVPLAARMDAAAKVAVYEHPRLAQTTSDVTAGLTIKIEGGLPALPGTEIIMPAPDKPTPTQPPPKTNGSGP